MTISQTTLPQEFIDQIKSMRDKALQNHSCQTDNHSDYNTGVQCGRIEALQDVLDLIF